MKFLKRKGSRLVFAVLFILLLSIVAIWTHFTARYVEYSAEIIRLQPLMARLVGMQQSEALFVEANALIRADLAQMSFSSPGGADAAAAELQRRVRGIAAEHSLSVSGSQVLPATEGQGYQQLAISMTIKGSMSSVPGFLGELGEIQPQVILSNVQISPARSRRGGPQNVSLRISVLALRTKV